MNVILIMKRSYEKTIVLFLHEIYKIGKSQLTSIEHLNGQLKHF
jgi:hypothetical protein